MPHRRRYPWRPPHSATSPLSFSLNLSLVASPPALVLCRTDVEALLVELCSLGVVVGLGVYHPGLVVFVVSLGAL